MREVLTIAGGEVRVGDELYNRHAYHVTAAWVRVTAVEARGDDVWISTTVWDTTVHRRQGIAVRRGVESDGSPVTRPV